MKTLFIALTKKEQHSDKQKQKNLTEIQKEEVVEDSNNPIINNNILSKSEEVDKSKELPDPYVKFAKEI